MAQASKIVGTAQNQANSAVNADNIAQQMMNNTRSTISNPGAGLGPVHLPVSVGSGRH